MSGNRVEYVVCVEDILDYLCFFLVVGFGMIDNYLG